MYWILFLKDFPRGIFSLYGLPIRTQIRVFERENWLSLGGSFLYISFFVEYDLFKEVRPLINTFKNDPHFLLLNKTSD